MTPAAQAHMIETDGTIPIAAVRLSIGWTDDRVAHCVELWHKGLSASKIAQQIGGQISRNGVIGKMHRLGLSGRVKAAADPQRKHVRTSPVNGETKVQAAPRVHRLGAAGFVVGAPDIELPPEPPSAPVCEPITIIELTAVTCRFPLGDPHTAEFRFCGAEAPVERPYCRYHTSIAYAESVPKRLKSVSESSCPV